MSTDPAAAPANPIGPAPPRRAGSVRRTSSIDTSWPEGLGKPVRMLGHARDLFTPTDDSPAQVLAEDRFSILASPRREILQIATTPERNLAQLVGLRGGGHLRGALARVVPLEKEAGTPLYLLLDDFSGASLVVGWAWSQWDDESTRQTHQQVPPSAGRNGRMDSVCMGFRPGSSALMSDGSPNSTLLSSAPVGTLVRSDDPDGWHELDQQPGVGMRRARRVDAWIDDVIHIDAGFQDSATSPEGGRVAIHEYQVSALADPVSFKLLDLKADPRVLPYRECPAASLNVSRMIGTPLRELRQEVLERLRGTLGCTHLNDVLRALAEVPQMLAKALG
jgi:hypothetical protein